MMLRRGLWIDVDLADMPDEQVMLHPGWTNDRESLSLAVREVGWFPTTSLSFQAAEAAELKWGWVGTNADQELVLCDVEGTPVGAGENVNDIAQVTLALVRTPA
jgi:hypothetical protein